MLEREHPSHTYTPLQMSFHSVVEAPGKVVFHVRFTILFD